MSRRALWAVGGALIVALLGAACGSEEVSGENQCTPGESQDCTCDGGVDSVQYCNSEGTGFSQCECGGGGSSGSGGSGGSSGGTGGGGSGGTGGSTGGSGGSTGGSGGSTDAGPMDASTDASDASTTPDGAPDGAGPVCAMFDGGDACDACMLENCCAESIACGSDACLNVPDGGITDYECIYVCLGDTAATLDGGALQIADVNGCVTDCGATNVSRDYFQCMFGGGGGTDCSAACGL